MDALEHKHKLQSDLEGPVAGNYRETVICLGVMTLITRMSLLVPIHLSHNITQLLVIVLM